MEWHKGISNVLCKVKEVRLTRLQTIWFHLLYSGKGKIIMTDPWLLETRNAREVDYKETWSSGEWWNCFLPWLWWLNNSICLLKILYPQKRVNFTIINYSKLYLNKKSEINPYLVMVLIIIMTNDNIRLFTPCLKILPLGIKTTWILPLHECVSTSVMFTYSYLSHIGFLRACAPTTPSVWCSSPGFTVPRICIEVSRGTKSSSQRFWGIF